MATTIRHDQVHPMLADGGQLVDVMPADEYQDYHIRGARSLPLKALNRTSTASLDAARPVIVYCNDSL
jgi:rhodanese-related sulfurtransferase